MSILLVVTGISILLFLYGRIINTVKYEKADDSLVEEMKEQMVRGNKDKTMTSLASSTLWSLVVTFYLAVSFLSGRWDVSWMIFPFASGLQNLVLAYLNPAKRVGHVYGAFWSFVVTIYLLISFWTKAWHITWMLFFFAVAAHQVIRLFVFWRKKA